MFNKKQSGDRDYTVPGTTTPSYSPAYTEAATSSTPASSPEETTSAVTTAPTSTAHAQPTAHTPSNAAGTFLAEGTTFQGKANVAGTMRIEGKADGEIEATESIVVGKSGWVQANLKTRRAILNGRFHGKIEATDRIEMQSGSRVEADVHAKNMVMEDGVQYSGNCRIGQ